MNEQGNSVAQKHDLTQCYDFWLKRGNCYISVDNYTGAQRCYEEAVSLGADDPQSYVGLGVVALEKRQFEDAKVAFKVALRLAINCSEAYCGLGLVYQQEKDYTKAFQIYLKCLELDTDNLTALSGLFQTSRQIRSFSKVRHYLEVYLKNHPSDAKVMFCLATLYMNDDQLNEAEKVLLDVLILEPAFVDAANLLEEVKHQLDQRKDK